MKHVLVDGNIEMGFLAEAEHISLSGEAFRGSQFETFHGRKSANQAVAVSRSAYPVNMIGCLGSDWPGQMLRNDLLEAGVGIRALKTAPGYSGVAHIARAAAGANSIVVVPGANHALSEVQILQTGDQIKIDLNKRHVDVLLSDEEIAARHAALEPMHLENQSPREEIYRSTIGQLETGGCMELATRYHNLRKVIPRHSH